VSSGGPSIVVRFATNVREFLAGTGQVEDALNDLGTDTRELATSSERDVGRMERALRDAGRSVDRVATDAGRSFANMGRVVDTTSDRVSRGVGNRFRRLGRTSGRDLAANIGEGFAGSAGSLEGVVSGTLNGLTALPVIGAFAGVGAVVVNNLISGANARKEAMSAAGRAAFDAFRDGYLDQAEKDEQLIAALGVKDLSEAVEQTRVLAEGLGVPFDDLYSFLQGAKPTAELERSMRQMRQDAADIRGDASLLARAFGGSEGVERAAEDSLKQLQKIEEVQERIAQSSGRAAENAALYRDAVNNTRPPRYPSASGVQRPGGGQRQ
jgi:hypothetical protein